MLVYTLEGISTSTKYTGMAKGSHIILRVVPLPENLVNE